MGGVVLGEHVPIRLSVTPSSFCNCSLFPTPLLRLLLNGGGPKRNATTPFFEWRDWDLFMQGALC